MSGSNRFIVQGKKKLGGEKQKMRKTLTLTIGLVLCIAMPIGVISVCAQGPELTAEQQQDLVARGDNYTVKGTATGVDIVDITFRGPGEFRGYSFELYFCRNNNR